MTKMDSSLLNEIKKSFPELKIDQDIPWKKLTTLGVGNACPVLVEIQNNETLSNFLNFCHNKEIDIIPLGNGSNIVGSDEEIDSVVIKLSSKNYTYITSESNIISCGSAATIHNLIENATTATKLRHLNGIPGTVGGSLRTNAGRSGSCIGDFIIELKGFDFKGNMWSSGENQITWNYRASSIPKDVIITSIRLNNDKEELGTINTDKQTDIPKFNHFTGKTTGCFFKNPLQGYSAGKLIELSNCRNISYGDAVVSSSHANFIININNALEKDIVDLAIHIKQNVVQHTGIYLDPEPFFANKVTYQKFNNAVKPLEVLILKGGNSREREVSLESATGVSKALRDAGYIVKELDITEPKLSDKYNNFQGIVFPVLHGGFGENGELQKELEAKSIKYVGCSSKVSQIIIDKIKTKNFFDNNNIPTPAYAVLKTGETTFPKELTLPVIVKPPTEGSTVGISIVRDMNQWLEALEKASGDVTGTIMVEQFISGIELTAPILDCKALQLVHICPPGEIYDYDAKYTHNAGETVYIAPPEESVVSLELQNKIKEYSIRAYNKIGARHMLRVDVLISESDKKLYFIEMNSLPGFTASSLLPKGAEAEGIPYIQLCSRLIQLAHND
ncbi:MAG: D-alanine--D-alanine ligase [bacterium]|nr:D-alanine--D-alanine ligase [bacterium]